jgi:Flp pilus assembly protein TadD
LYRQGKRAEAEAAYRKAIKIKPDLALAHTNLGVILHEQGKLAEAEAAHRKALALKPDDPLAHSNLGAVLGARGKLAEAEAAFRKAIALKPAYAEAHCNLGVALHDRGKLGAAELAFRKAIEFQADHSKAHFGLGNTLRDQGKLSEAAAALRKAIALQPAFAEAHCSLGDVLLRQGRFAKGEDALQRGDELGRRRPDWPYPSARWLQRARRLVALDARLPKLLSGEAQPNGTAERLALAELCQLKKRYAAAVRFYAEAFDAQPALAEHLQRSLRYGAACSAALAGCGKDAAPLDDETRARLRRRALRWLSADLAAWRGLLKNGPARARPVIAGRMQHWLKDNDFYGMRGSDALAKLPEPERVAWDKLWADVANTLARAQTISLNSDHRGGRWSGRQGDGKDGD